MLVIDTHCHIQRDTSNAGGDAEEDTHRPPDGEGDVLYCPMAVDEGDWAAVLKLRGSIAAYGLGIHPWRAHKATAGWEGRLEAALRADPAAIVGECGLDKAAKTPETGQTEWAAQQAVFEAQMRLAATLERPVSVHCVRAHGALYEYLREAQAKGEGATPPTVALHSYTGSPELAISLCRLPRVGEGIFFGFSAAVNLKTPAMGNKLQEVVARIPYDRILLESDLDERRPIPSALGRVAEALAAATGMECLALVALCQRNAARFLRRPAVP